VSVQDFYDGLPPPALDDEALGVPPLAVTPPVPPAMVPGPDETKRRKILAAATLIGAALGGRPTYGFGQGMLGHFAEQDRQRDLDQQQQQRQYEVAADQYQAAASERQRQVAARGQLYAETLTEFAAAAAARPDAYEGLLQAYTTRLQQLGYRVDPNSLRRVVPKVRPNVEAKAKEVFSDWLSANRKAYEENPDGATKGVILFDRDGDGIPERVPVWQVGALAGLIGTDADGAPIFAPKGVLAKEYKAGIEGRLEALQAQAIAEGKELTPALVMALQDEAEAWWRAQLAKRHAAQRDQPAPAGTGASGESPLIPVILDNPALFDRLTPTMKESLIPGLAARGFDFTGAHEATPSMRAGITRLTTSLTMLEALDRDLTQRTGIAGRVAGRGQEWWAALTGEDTPATLYKAVSDSLLPALARSSGEVGNLAEREQTRYARLAPRVTDPLNIRQAKYAAIRYIIDAANKGARADELASFLDYTQFVSEAVPSRAEPRSGTIGPYTFREVK
jgi:hypothetical protein